MSRPVWGAWIEMQILAQLMGQGESRAPYGARGLKFNGLTSGLAVIRVAPRMGRVD